jgi:hypothetical protein
MIARVQDTQAGFVIFIPEEYVKAWHLRQDFLLEVHRVGSTHEADEPEAIYASQRRMFEAYESTLHENDAAYRELAKGPEGRGPYDGDPLPPFGPGRRD